MAAVPSLWTLSQYILIVALFVSAPFAHSEVVSELTTPATARLGAEWLFLQAGGGRVGETRKGGWGGVVGLRGVEEQGVTEERGWKGKSKRVLDTKQNRKAKS